MSDQILGDTAPSDPIPAETAFQRLALRIEGTVQGVGFRPFVYREAVAQGLAGWVSNGPGGVDLEIQGTTDALQIFLSALHTRLPVQASITRVDTRSMTLGTETAFTIADSTMAAEPRPVLPADLALCGECAEEIQSPAHRRYRYPFTNCTNCGPRYSIIERLPYDRPHTSMKDFTLCGPCSEEYRELRDRRFHAQPVACPACGPVLHLLDATGEFVAQGDSALQSASDAVVAGQIVATKGLGGFQFIVDAANDPAVTRLRKRKNREAKPFAILFPSLAAARLYCRISEEEARVLTSHQAPIVLLRRRSDAPPLSEGVAPRNPYLGALLPYTPMHLLLMNALARPVICTSGNVADEPMCTQNSEAVKRLGSIADRFLAHNRPIVRPVDDSIARIGPAGLELLRRARGYAPLALPLAEPVAGILALGGQLKATIALGFGSQAVISQHLGNLDTLEGAKLLESTADDLLGFFRVTPRVLACDLHPDYLSSRLAERLAKRWEIPLEKVQHHHAHIAACIAEHGLCGKVLGFAWDGSGLGTDNTLWGGEALLCDDAGFQRLAFLKPFSLPGGETAIREPRRAALGLLHSHSPALAARFAPRWFSAQESSLLLALLDRGFKAVSTSSIGRLFDAVAALAGLRERNLFEGQAAMELEFAADGNADAGAYPFPLTAQGNAWIADWGPLLDAVLADVAQGTPPATLSVRFHNALADMALATAARSGVRKVVLAGGCFQNQRLAATLRRRLTDEGFEVYSPRLVPANDGGLSLGQLLIAARRMAGRERAQHA